MNHKVSFPVIIAGLSAGSIGSKRLMTADEYTAHNAPYASSHGAGRAYFRTGLIGWEQRIERSRFVDSFPVFWNGLTLGWIDRIHDSNNIGEDFCQHRIHGEAIEYSEMAEAVEVLMGRQGLEAPQC